MPQTEDGPDDILTLSEVAAYLKVAEKTVSRMIAAGEIPCAKVGNQWRFRRDLLDSWLLSRMQGERDADPAIGAAGVVPLSRITSPNLISTEIKPGEKAEVLRQLVGVLATSPVELDSRAAAAGPSAVARRTTLDSFFRALIRRERLASTGLGQGVAVPHVREPAESPTLGPDLIVGVCREGTDFDALDGQTTHLFFVLSTRRMAAHLRTLAQIARLSRDARIVSSLINAESSESLWRALVRYDQQAAAGGMM